MIEEAEPRPLVHVTPPSGWLNDPVGGLVHGGRQHLFFQYVPTATEWRHTCHWGHLVGDDLVRWRHLPVALAPGDGDDGVWSGSAVVDEGGPVLFYTSVLDGQLDLGRVALARPADGELAEGAPGGESGGREPADGELVRWRKHDGGPVLLPPPDLDLAHFRDPFVWGRTGAWRMLVGAGLRDRGGAVLRYSAADLHRWRYDGVLAEAGPGSGLGDVWECPQYVDLDGGPALVVSIMNGGQLDRVIAARGRAEGDRFVPGRWQVLGYGRSAYALTTYRDRAGLLVGTAWLRDGPPGVPRRDWAGMLSLPVHLTAGADGDIHVAPHPDVDTLRTARLAEGATGVELTDGLADLEVTLAAGARLRLDTDAAPVVLAYAEDGLTVESGGEPTVVPVLRPGSELSLRVVVDRGVVEAWTGEGRWAAVRVLGLRVRAATVLGGGRLDAWALDPVQEPA
ncbi:MAG TPA: glycoside hydrolase family 32 protein [Mycobacteriales bacterium]